MRESRARLQDVAEASADQVQVADDQWRPALGEDLGHGVGDDGGVVSEHGWSNARSCLSAARSSDAGAAAPVTLAGQHERRLRRVAHPQPVTSVGTHSSVCAQWRSLALLTARGRARGMRHLQPCALNHLRKDQRRITRRSPWSFPSSTSSRIFPCLVQRKPAPVVLAGARTAPRGRHRIALLSPR